jgi:hypothetical protein
LLNLNYENEHKRHLNHPLRLLCLLLYLRLLHRRRHLCLLCQLRRLLYFRHLRHRHPCLLRHL